MAHAFHFSMRGESRDFRRHLQLIGVPRLKYPIQSGNLMGMWVIRAIQPGVYSGIYSGLHSQHIGTLIGNPSF